MTLIFLHIPKTAGISLRQVLINNTPGPAFRIIHPIEDAERLANLSLAERSSLKLVDGHLYYGIHNLLPQPCRYMTVLRDPVERVLSLYSFIREYKDHSLYQAINAPGFTLADCFRTGFTVELDNFMVRCLTDLRNVHTPFGGVTRTMLDEAKANLERIELIGLTEEYDRSVHYFCRSLGWPHALGPRLNSTSVRLNRLDLYDAEMDLIREHNRLDADLYEFGAALFRSRVSAAPGGT